ncbi:MAG: phage major capsid protein [Nitrospirae bacterium]|nr:phage major capsid protein [Nitrospirota bacterium]
MDYKKNDFKKNKEKIELLEAKIAEWSKLKLNSAQTEIYNEMITEVRRLKELPESAPLTVDESMLSSHIAGTKRAYELRGPADKKDYRTLFGTEGYQWQDKESTFFQAAFSGRHHPGLIRAMTETIGSDGGFLIPAEYTEKIHNVSLENEIVMPRAYVQPMRSNSIRIPAMEVGDHSASLFGGFTASYTDETGTINEKNPKVRRMELNAKKLTGLLRFSNELVADMSGGETQLTNICGKGLAWYRDKSFLKGTGAGEPLGILNSGCLIQVAKEIGQAADTIVYRNLTKMLARMYPGSFNNSVWICHISTIPELLEIVVPIGTGGHIVPVLTESNGVFKILTRPAIFTEKTEPVGDKGDILLCDLSQYVVGLRSEMRLDLSIHVHFQTDELLARLIERHDGQPLWDKALTLEDGTTTVSPFIVLAERN